MAQQIKALVTKPDDPQNPHGRRGEPTPISCPLTATCTPPPNIPYTKISEYKNILHKMLSDSLSPGVEDLFNMCENLGSTSKQNTKTGSFSSGVLVEVVGQGIAKWS